MSYLTIGRLVYSNISIRHDVMFYAKPAKHLFWRFWWSKGDE